jgi:hypothetical protein
MKNANEMTIELQSIFYDLKSGKIKAQEAAVLTNCVGKMIGLARTQLEYYTLRKEAPTLEFLASISDSTKKQQ